MKFNSLKSIVSLCAIVLPSASWAAGAGDQLPTWPQQLRVQGSEVASFGFAVTQPGPVRVQVRTDRPVVATLLGARGTAAEQQGGAVVLQHVVTPEDVQATPFWVVTVRQLANAPQDAASGTIDVQAPPADLSVVQTASDAARRNAKPRNQIEAELTAGVPKLRAQIEADERQQNAVLEQQLGQRRNAMLAQLQPTVERLRADAQVATRALSPPPGSKLMLKQAIPSPAIATLNVTQAYPGDPVLINGSAFGNSVGKVHFVINPGRDVVADAATVIWRDNQVFASVPANLSGFVASNGTLYVERADSVKSNLIPLTYLPLIERRAIVFWSDDVALQQYNGVYAYIYSALDEYRRGVGIIGRQHGQCFWSPSGNDRILANTRLKNGWKVSGAPRVFMPNPYYANGGALLVDSRVGTDWPFADVRWWVNVNPFCQSSVMYYAVSIPIEGPLGIPDGINVK